MHLKLIFLSVYFAYFHLISFLRLHLHSQYLTSMRSLGLFNLDFEHGNRCYLPGNCAETNDDHRIASWPRIFEKFFILSLTLNFFHQYFLLLYDRAPPCPPPVSKYSVKTHQKVKPCKLG